MYIQNNILEDFADNHLIELWLMACPTPYVQCKYIMQTTQVSLNKLSLQN